MSAAASAGVEQLSATTGEPADVVARRNRLGIWLIIVSCSTGTLALLISYLYLWSLNVSGAWAPTPGTANWAADWPFWAITLGMVVATFLLWRAWRVMRSGSNGAAGLAWASTLLFLILFVGQVVQIATFPFGPQDGAYASATLWIAVANAIWLFMALVLASGVANRCRVGRVSQGDPSQLQFVAMFATYLCVAALLGSVFTLTMKASPNQSSPAFGTFSQPK